MAETPVSDAIAEYLAKGGKITKVDADASTGYTARDWRKACRGEAPFPRGSDNWLREMGFVEEAKARARGRP